MVEFGSGPTGGGQFSESKGAKKSDLMNICACGNHADIKGYCEICLEKLGKKHDYLVQKFEDLNKEYAKFKPDDIKKQD